MIGKTLSGAIALSYLLVASFAGGGEAAFKMAVFLIFPLACIWFSEAMGDYVGPTFGRPGITQTTPGCIVAVGGWLLLFLPVIVAIVAHLSAPG